MHSNLDQHQVHCPPPSAPDDQYSRPDELGKRYAGSIVYTLDDEEFEPFGRSFDVRIFYNWRDYHPADEPSSRWGPTIEEIEVLNGWHYDQDGNEIPSRDGTADTAWRLLERVEPQVIEACTVDGYRRGIGQVPGTYAAGPSRSSPAATQPSIAVRLAASQPTRTGRQDRRQFG